MPENVPFNRRDEHIFKDVLEKPGKEPFPSMRSSDIPWGRYETFFPGLNNEEYYAQKQSFLDKVGNGVAKAAGTFTSAFLEGTVGVINGLSEWSRTGKFSSFYDNEFNRKIDDINKSMEDALPNYYTQAEKDAEWYSPTNIFSGNFLGDKVLKNLGFSFGAIAGGGAWGALLKNIGLASKLIRAGEGLKTVEAVESAMVNASKVERFGEVSKALNSTWNSVKNQFGGPLSNADRLIISSTGMLGEATIEAYQATNEFRNKLIQEHKALYGTDPSEETIKEINNYAENVGNTVFATNAALLTFSNYIQLPKILGSSRMAEKRMINNIEKEGLSPLDKFITTAPSTGNILSPVANLLGAPGRFINKYALGPGRLAFSTSEAIEEGLQYATQVGSEDYFERAFSRGEEAKDFLESVSGALGNVFTEGVKKALSEKEGLESILIGGFSGALQKSYQNVKERGFSGVGGTYQANTALAVDALNKTNIQQVLQDGAKYTAIGIESQQRRQDAIAKDDVLGEKDYEKDFELSYILPRVKYGKVDAIANETAYYRQQASTESGFRELKDSGVVAKDESREKFLQRLTNLEATAKSVNTIYEQLEDKYGNVRNSEGKVLYTPEVIDKMAYATAKVIDYDTRSAEMRNKLVSKGITISNLTSAIASSESFKTKKYKDVMKENAVKLQLEEINKQIDETGEINPEDTIKEVGDFTDMVFLRQKFIDDINEMKVAPEKFTTQVVAPVMEEQPSGEQPKIIKVTRKEGNDLEFVIGKEYMGFSPSLASKEGPEYREYRRFTITGVSEDGKILSIKDQVGKVRNVKLEDFEKFMQKFGAVNMEKVNSDPNIQFVLEASDQIFTYQLGSGKLKKGIIQYDLAKKALKFVTLDGKSTYYVSRNQFVPKPGFKNAQIYSNEKLTKIAESALLKPITADELRERYDEKDEILNGVLQSSKKRIDEVNKHLESAKKELQKTNDALENLTTTKKGLPKKRLDKAVRKTVNVLADIKEDLEKDILSLEEEKDELEAAVSYFEELIANKDQLPEESSEIIKDMQEDVKSLEEAIDFNNSAIKSSKSLLKVVEDSLKNALSLLNDYAKRLVEENPDIPITIEAFREKIERYLGEEGAKQFVADRLGFTQAVMDLEEQISDFSDELQIPDLTERTKKLKEELEELEKQLDEMIESQIKKVKILQMFEKAAEEFEKRLEEEAFIQSSEKIQKEILGTKYNGPQNKVFDEKYEPESKKSDEHVVAGSMGVMRGKDHQTRANTFGFRFNLFNKEVKDRIFGVHVTSKNEEALGMKGLVDKFTTGDDGNVDTEIKRDEVIVFVIVHQNKEGNIIPVGVDGLPIPEGQDFVENGIYQVKPMSKLAWSAEFSKDGKEQSMFRDPGGDGRKDVIESLKKQYDTWRKSTIADENSYKKLRKIGVSFGRLEEVKDDEGKPNYETTTPVAEAGLISESQLENNVVIRIPTTNEKVRQGTVSFNTPLGRVFLNLPNGLVRLKNKRHSIKNAQTIHQAIVRYAELVYDGKSKTPEAERILTWLKSVTYWGIPETKEGGRKDSGYNSIFFERNETTGKLMLSISGKEEGREIFEFSPSKLKKEKNIIVGLITGMYTNTNNSMVKNLTQEYEEILSIGPDGTVESRIWKNYQTYLLSKNFPNGQERKEEIPLTTVARPLVSNQDVNRTSIYFYTDDGVDDFTVPKPVEKKKPEGVFAKKPSEEKPKGNVKIPVPSNNKFKIVGNIKLDGRTPIVVESSQSGLQFQFSASSSVNPSTYEGIEIYTGKDFDKINDELKKTTPDPNDRKRKLKAIAYSLIKNELSDEMEFELGDDGLLVEDDRDIPSLVGEEFAEAEDEEDDEKNVSPTITPAAFTTKKDKEDEDDDDESSEEESFFFEEEEGEEKEDDDYEDDEEPNRLFEQSVKTFEPENWNKVEQWLKANFPSIPVYRVKNILQATNGRQAWGMFKNGAIYVYENAEVGTVYHEVFHAVWRMASDREEKKKIFSEMRARKGTFFDKQSLKDVKFAEASAKQLEEVLAEEFRDYVQFKKIPAKPETGRPFVLKLFSDLVSLIKDFFFGRQSVSKVEEMFSKINQGAYASSIPFERGLSFANSGVIDIDDIIATDDAVLSLVSLSDVERNDVIQEMLYRSLVKVSTNDESLFKELDLTRSYLDGELKQAILNNLSKYIAYIDKKKGSEEEVKRAEIQKKNIEASWDVISKRYEEYLKSYGIEFDDNDQAQLTDEDKSGRENYQDATKIDSFKKANSAIKLLLASIPKTYINSKGEVKRRLSTVKGSILIPISQTYITLISKLYNSSNTLDMLERLRQLAEENSDYRALYKRITRKSYDAGPASVDEIDKQHGSQLISALWKTFKKQSPDVFNVYVLENGDVVVGEANLSTAARKLKNDYVNGIVRKARNEKDGLFTTDLKNKKFIGNTKRAKEFAPTVIGGMSTYKSMVRFLNALGIDFNEKNIGKMASYDKTKFEEIVGGIYKSVAAAGEIVTFSGKSLDLDGRLLELAIIQAKIENPDYSSTYFNISGERSQTFIGPNPMSELSNFLKGLVRFNGENVYDTPYNYLVKDSFAQGSNLLERMFGSEGDPISGRNDNSDLLSVGIVGGVEDQNKGKRKQSSKLNYRERLIQELNLNFKGWYLNLVPGDASIEHMVKMGNGVSLVDLDRGFGKIHDIFGKYFMSELELVREDDRPVAEGRDRKTFRFFNDILSDDLKKRILKSKLSTEKVYKEFKSEIDKAVEKKVLKEAGILQELMEKYGLYVVNEKGNYELQEISNGERNFGEQEEKTFNKTLNFLSVNYMIANIELHKLLYSDPYQYSDELKRIKQFLSPRQMIVNGSQEMSSLYNKVWNKGYESKDIGRTEFTREYFRSATHTDVMGVINLPGYGKFKATDGSGIISFKAHRHLRIRAGEWNDNEERQYRYDIAWEKNDKGLRLSEEELVLYAAGNPGIQSAYTPLKPIVAGTLLDKNGNPADVNNIVLDKFALYPLSYRIVKEINPTANALKLYEKMQKENIDYITFPSGRKVGAGSEESQHQTYKDGKFNEEAYKNILNIPFSAISIQAEVPSKEETSVTRGSQITKLVTMDFMDAGVPIDFMPEEEDFTVRYETWFSPSTDKTQSRIYNKIKNNESLLKELIDLGYRTTLKEFGIVESIDTNGRKTFQIPDLSNAGKILLGEILKREANDNISASLNSFINGTAIIEATPAYQQVRNILYSIADRNFISQKINGSMKVQIPVAFFESGEVREEEINGKKGVVSDTLKMYEKGGKNIIELMLPRWFESSLSDEELINYFNNTEEGKKQLAAIAGVAYRIPTQNQNSFDSFVIKKFLPKEFGDSVVIPAALVEKAGSDFDIDKLSLYLKSVFIGKGGKPKLIEFLTNENSTVGERFVHWVRENANVDTRRYIKFLTRSQVNNLRTRYELETSRVQANLKALRKEMNESSYQNMQEEIAKAKSQLPQDDYMKELFAEGAELFWSMNENLIDEFLELKEELRTNDVKGPTEIATYLSFAQTLLLTRKNISSKDKPLLRKMVNLYKQELRVLGASEEAVDKIYQNAVETFREVKKADYDWSKSAVAQEFKTVDDRYEEAKQEQALEVAKEIAEIDGLASIEEFEQFSIYKQNVKKALENAYIQSMQDLIEDELNYDKLIKPNSAKELKDLADRVAKKTTGQSFDYKNVDNMLNRGFMSRLRHAFVTGKYAIGIAAVNQTNHSLNQRQPIYVDSRKFSLISKTDRQWMGGNTDIKFKQYNSAKINGRTVPILSMIKNQEGKYISDIIGQFIDGYVDISKGPWIMELGATPNVASTYLFLIKLGVPVEDVVFFMNQPIIRDYLGMIENSGYSWLFIDDFFNAVDSKYGEKPLTTEQIKTFKIPGAKTLEKNLGRNSKSMSAEELVQQRLMLKEFVKYAKMAEHMFHVTQGSNFDTANFNDPFLVFKKHMQYLKAKNTIISSVDALIENSFLSNLVQALIDSRNAFAEILTSDKLAVRNVLEAVLLPYIDMGDRDFVKMARKAVVDLFDYALQTNEKFNKDILNILVNDSTNVSDQLQELIDEVDANPDHVLRGNEAIRLLKTIPSKTIGGVNNIEIITGDNRVYDQNNIIYGLRQLKNHLGTTKGDLYDRLLKLAVIQSGLSTSSISFTSLLPYEDFEKLYSTTLSRLASIPNLMDFYRLGVFQRNNWNNDDVVPYMRAKWIETMDGLRYNPSMEFLPKVVRDAVASKEIPPVVSISTMGRDAQKNYIVYTWEKQNEVLTDEELKAAKSRGSIKKAVKEKKTEMRRRGDYSFINKALFQKVVDPDSGDALIHTSNGREYFTYKAINAWGDSFRANEFYSEERPSVLENGFMKIKNPVVDNVIISKFAATSKPTMSDRVDSPATQPNERIAELENKMKTKGLGPDEMGELTRLRIEKGKQIQKEC